VQYLHVRPPHHLQAKLKETAIVSLLDIGPRQTREGIRDEGPTIPAQVRRMHKQGYDPSCRHNRPYITKIHRETRRWVYFETNVQIGMHDRVTESTQSLFLNTTLANSKFHRTTTVKRVFYLPFLLPRTKSSCRIRAYTSALPSSLVHHRVLAGRYATSSSWKVLS
jgi:hypothetical protein